MHAYGTIASGGAFLIMERLYGQTWRAILRERKTIEREPTVWLAIVRRARRRARQGVVHRDLAGERHRSGDGRFDATLVKVLDFGIAKQIDGQGDTDAPACRDRSCTLGYMPPEQLAAKTVDHRADIFAVGVMAWEALCGSRPFGGSTVAELAIAMQSAPQRRPIGLSPTLTGVLDKALSPDAGRRHASAAELKRSLISALKS